VIRSDRALALTPKARVRLELLAQGSELRPALAEWFPRAQSVAMGPADCDISGHLAYGVMRVLVVPADGGRLQAGPMAVAARGTSGRRWIRAQYPGLLTLG
jgi:hypothetical protein